MSLRSLAIIFLSYLILPVSSARAQSDYLAVESTPELVKEKVERAVKLVETEGEAAFAQLRDKKGEFWFDRGKGYVFCFDKVTEIMLVHLAMPRLEGNDSWGKADSSGFYLAKAMIEVVNKYGSGWVVYYWPKPGKKIAELKASYVKMARYGGADYVIGSGIYNVNEAFVKMLFPNDAVFSIEGKTKTLELKIADKRSEDEKAETLNLQTVKFKAEKAAKFIADEGEAAFPRFRDKNGEFWFAQGKGYVWVSVLDGKLVVHPAQPELEGVEALTLKDSGGYYFSRAISDLVKKHGAGWVVYYWVKPGLKMADYKGTYVKLVRSGGIDYVVGCGMYNIDKKYIQSVFPKDIVYSREPDPDTGITGEEVKKNTENAEKSAGETEHLDFGMSYPEYMTPQLVKAKVEKAARLIETDGEAAFEKFRDKKGEFWFAGGKGYLWVCLNGKLVVQPAQPELEGGHPYSFRDPSGYDFCDAAGKIIATRGVGWVLYCWMSPGDGAIRYKSSYIKKVSCANVDYVVGSNVSDISKQDIISAFPDDLICCNDPVPAGN